MGFSLVILLCTKTLLIFLIGLRVLLLFTCKLRLLLWASVFNFKGAYFDTLLVLALRNFSYTMKAAIHHEICCHQEHLSLHNWSCCALLCWRWEGHEKSREHWITHLAQNCTLSCLKEVPTQDNLPRSSAPQSCFFSWMQEFSESLRWLISYLWSSNAACSSSYKWMTRVIICCCEKQ